MSTLILLSALAGASRPNVARRLLAHIGEWFMPRESLSELDDRQLADIGVNRSEIESIEAEARLPAAWQTRRRLVDAGGCAG